MQQYFVRIYWIFIFWNIFDKLVAGNPKVFGIHPLGTSTMAIHLIAEVLQTIMVPQISPLPLSLKLHRLKTNRTTSIKMTKFKLKAISLLELHIFESVALPSLMGH